jgi:hypothetical protein
MKTCITCQRVEIPDAARFCPDCGAALPVSEALTSEAPTSEPPPVATGPSAPLPPAPSTTIDVKQEVGQLAGGKAIGVEVGGVAGDMTVNQQGDTFSVSLGNVGAGAQFAVGKQISQTGAAPAPTSAADRAELTRGLEAVGAALDDPAVPANRQLIGREFLSQIAAQLTGGEGPPDAATLKVAVDWLLNNVPSLAPSLRALFASPAGVRALAAAGEPAIGWARARLG